MSALNILHVMPSLQQSYGGPIRAVLDLSARAEGHGVNSELLGFGPLHIVDNPLHAKAIHSLELSFPRSYGYSAYARPWLKANLNRYGGVVIHGMWTYANWIVSRECKAQNKPYAYFPHGMLEPWPIFGQGRFKTLKKVAYWKLFEDRIFRNAVATMFTTKTEAERAQATVVRLGSHCVDFRSVIVPYGVAVCNESVERPENPKLAVPANRKIALFLGRVHPKKNVAMLIDAWREAQPSREWQLVIAGPSRPEYLKQLRQIVRDGQLEDQVSFLGVVTGQDKAYLFQRAQWFLLASSQENFGNAVLEAIQYGCPTVISDQVYFSEFLHDRSEVLPVRRDAWVKFLRERLGDEARRQEIIGLDQRLVRPAFDINRVGRQWADALRQVFSN